MAIHPRHADAILAGDKRVEFRKRRLAPDIRVVLVYATAPVSRVIGDFAVEGFVHGRPDDVWDAVHEVGGISKEEFGRYYGDSDAAVAIKVGSVRKYAAPVALRDLSPVPAVPQSYCYVSGDVEAQACALGFATVRTPLLRRVAGSVRALVGRRTAAASFSRY